MNTQQTKYDLSAEQFAALNQVKSQSVRARLCRTGSYFGIRPVKLANGRLAFPSIQVECGNIKNIPWVPVQSVLVSASRNRRTFGNPFLRSIYSWSAVAGWQAFHNVAGSCDGGLVGSACWRSFWRDCGRSGLATVPSVQPLASAARNRLAFVMAPGLLALFQVERQSASLV